MKETNYELYDSTDNPSIENFEEYIESSEFFEEIESESETNAEVAAEYAEFEGFERLADFFRNNYRQDYPGEVDVSKPLSIRTVNDTRMLDEDSDVPYNSRTFAITDSVSVEGVFPDFPVIYELFTGDDGVGNTRFEHNEMCNELLSDALSVDPSLWEIFTQQEIDEIKNGELPEKYTWHHEPEIGHFSLVETAIHNENRHTGGYALWGAKEAEFYKEINDSSD